MKKTVRRIIAALALVLATVGVSVTAVEPEPAAAESCYNYLSQHYVVWVCQNFFGTAATQVRAVAKCYRWNGSSWVYVYHAYGNWVTRGQPSRANCGVYTIVWHTYYLR